MKFANANKKTIALYLFLLFPFIAAHPHEPDYGLKFHAYSYEPEMRTGLDLCPGDFFSLPGGFSLSFDVKFEFKEIQTYGYVFRIIDKNGSKIDFVLGDKNVSFSSSPGNIIFVKTFDEVELRPEQWMKIRLEVGVRKSELKIGIGNIVRRWTAPEVKNFDEVRIVFGKNNYPETQAVDVPNMTIRDIKIENKNTCLYHWKLSKHTAAGVYDELKKRFAKCENPDWALTQNAVWKKESTFTCDGNPYIAYNPDQNVIAVADQRLFYSFSLNDKRLRKQTVTRGLAYPRYANQMIYNSADSSYYVYNLVKEDDGRELAAFDPATGAWAETTPHSNYSDYWHHNRSLSVKNSKLYLFGGYGHHKYKRNVFLYDLLSKAWSKKELAGDSIGPRYLSGLGVIDDRYLLRFGGYGSQSGNQELSPQHYYDAYRIDLETLEATRLWTLKTPEENFVVSNSMIVDTENDCFYALCYSFTRFNTSVTLRRFSLSEPKYEILADTIPLGFKDAGSFVDLFLDRANRELVAVTSSSIAIDSLASVSVYTLAWPPCKKADLQQPEKSNNGLLGMLLLPGFGLAIALFVFIYYKKRKAKALRSAPVSGDASATGSGIGVVKTIRKQAITLFGGFQIIDKNGNDLTSEFKPLVKTLFLLVLLNTIKNGKGISFLKLKEILWFDMTDESANNNRGVAMSKIRQIMKHVGDVRFLKRGIYWTVEFGDDIYCDYWEALVLIRKIKESKEINLCDVKKLLSIVSGGELLPNMQVEWADAFKSDFANDFVDLIMPFTSRAEPGWPDALYIDVANAIFIHDPLNEEALRLKCSILVKMGKNGLAKNAYTTFVKAYAAWFAADYKFSFDQVIS